jgi:xanthine dehydrogenase molybdopterin-binding subunit B
VQEFSHSIDTGDVDAAFAASDHVVEGVAKIGAQEHFYLEPFANIAIPEENDEFVNWASTQVCTTAVHQHVEMWPRNETFAWGNEDMVEE